MAPFMGLKRGYWGTTDSLVDWCEPNYIVSYYVAEFYNTFSSLPITVLAIIGIYVTMCGKNGTKEIRFLVTFLLLGSVGIGSAAFHLTLRYWGQLFDELPMMLGSLALLYCIYMTDSTPNQSHWKVTAFFIAWGSLQIYLYLFYQWYFLFLLNYGGQTLAQAVFGYTKCKRLANATCRRLFGLAIYIYLCGLTLWLVDQKYCHQLQGLINLHAFWHIFAGYASYLAVFTAIVCRAKFLNKKTELKLAKLCEAVPIAHYIIFADDKEL
eukprot:CAMPEP_0197055528 /NCGR_PEP_ID=MMETSP1384-20130603/67361_1 /TAXON_ID=29189 /ORGANISM="Ammonia sp." /LENGTH=266 /DNA_ID=CAMNT_0042489141 /DNA_START=29 /DNA_END=829 /DNA_ORIENTATION=+